MKPKILVHFCCAPCGMEMVSCLKKDFTIIGLWCNPNIQPAEEHIRRKASFFRLGNDEQFPCIDMPTAWVSEWHDAVKQAVEEGRDRCEACYALRMHCTISAMREEGITYCTTTLLSSPFQKHELVKRIGEDIGRAHFIYKDFRPVYYKGKNEAYRRGYYLQKYCGCLFSRAERSLGARIPHRANSSLTNQ